MGVLEMMEAAKRDSVIHRLNPFSKGIFCICMIAIPIVDDSCSFVASGAACWVEGCVLPHDAEAVPGYADPDFDFVAVLFPGRRTCID